MSPLLYQLSYTASAAKLTTYGDRVKRGERTVPEIVPASHFARRVLQIGRRNNVIAIEHCACAVSGDPRMLTTSGTPERMRFRAAVRRGSCRSIPDTPTALHALVQLFLKSRMRSPWNRPYVRCGKRYGMTRPSFLERVLTRSSCSSSIILTLAERYTTRPSPVLLPPGLIRSVPALRSTWLSVKVNTSDCIRHP